MEIQCNSRDEHDDAKEKKLSRKEFLKLAGLAGIGLAGACTAHEGADDSQVKDTSCTDRSLSAMPNSEISKIDLSSNLNPYGPAPVAINAMTGQLHRSNALSGINRYPDFMSLDIRGSAAKLNNVSPLKIVPVCGISEALNILCAAYLRNGGEIVTTDPTWEHVEKQSALWGADVVKVPLDGNNKIDSGEIIDSITSDTRMIYLMNPHNPAGTIITEEKMKKLLEGVAIINLFRKESIITVIDEAYGEYADSEAFPDTAKYCGVFPAVVLRTASFAYGMAGLRCGYAIARRDIASVMDGCLLYYLNSALNSDAIAEIIPGRKGWKHPEGNLNRLAESGFIASLEKGQKHIEFVRELNRKSMKLTCDKLDEIGVKYIPSQASFILIQTDETLMSFNETMTEGNPPQFLFDKGRSPRQGDFGKAVSNGIDGKTAVLRLAEKNIIVRDGNDFCSRYKNFIRVSIGTENEMTAFVSALTEILQ